MANRWTGGSNLNNCISEIALVVERATDLYTSHFIEKYIYNKNMLIILLFKFEKKSVYLCPDPLPHDKFILKKEPFKYN